MNAKDTNSIAFQGVYGAHSDMACRNAFPYMNTLPCISFEAVFEAVERGDAKLGLIPIENSHAGRVAEIHNILLETKLNIVGEYFHRVTQNILGIKGAKLEEVKTVYSHSQGLMQCRNTLKKLKITHLEPYFDTAGAARDVAAWKDPTKAAIASHLASDLYGLEVLKANAQDKDDNVTLFVAVSKEPVDPDVKKGKVLTSMIFTTRNIPAGLYKALGGFATNNVNLLKLESYMLNNRNSSAQFFVTFEGHTSEPHVQLAIEELGFFSKEVKLLGIYHADPARYKTSA